MYYHVMEQVLLSVLGNMGLDGICNIAEVAKLMNKIAAGGEQKFP
jgi:hypothetical protein